MLVELSWVGKSQKRPFPATDISVKIPWQISLRRATKKYARLSSSTSTIWPQLSKINHNIPQQLTNSQQPKAKQAPLAPPPNRYGKRYVLILMHRDYIVVSWLITRFRNRVPGCWNRVEPGTRIWLYSIFFFFNSCLLNWFWDFWLLAPNVIFGC